MPIPVCPVCHKRASIVGQQLYCMNCGWNREAGIRALRGSMRVTPVGIVMFTGFVLFLVFVWHFRNPTQIAIIAVPLAFGLAFNYFYYKNRLTKLQGLRVNASAQPATETAWSGQPTNAPQSQTETAATFPPDPKYEALLSVPCPRRIRVSTRGKISLFVGLIVVTVFGSFVGKGLYATWARTQSFAGFGSKDWLLVGLAVLLLLIPYGIWRGQVRECDLLENGEVAMARITGQWLNRDDYSIQYEFTDFMGQSHQGMCSDNTQKLQQGMSVPVFYDRNNPNRQIAYCATLHDIVV